MGLAFPNKIITLLELHRGNSWLKRQYIFHDLSTNHRDGFFYTNKEGKIECVSENTIVNALHDASYWQFLELAADKSRLSEFGLKAKDRGKVVPRRLALTLADILDKRTREWAGDEKAMDLNKFLNEVRNLPTDMIPTPYQIWLYLEKHLPYVFAPGKLTRMRLSQFLALLGSRGAYHLEETRVQIYLFPDDPRLKTIRMPKKGD